MPVEPMSYESLRKRQQLERGSPKLTRLEGDFYRNLELYLQGLQEDTQREHAANPHGPKATLLGDELQNTRRLAEDLYEHREGKVIKAALTAARGGAPDVGPMLPEEQALFEGLVQLLRDTKRRVLHRAPAAGPAVAPAPAPAPAGAPAAAAAPAVGLAPAAQSLPPEGRVLVRVLEDVGTFTASDLRAYNVRREDVLSLPADTAKLLILRGKAVEVVPA